MADENNTPDNKDKLKDKLDGLNLDKMGDATKSTLKKGLSLFKKAKDAFNGDENAKQELTDAASKTIVKAHEKAEEVKKTLGEITDKVEKKIEEKLDQKKPKAPTP